MSNTTMADALTDAATRKELRAIIDATNALRERVDAEMRAVYGRVGDMETRLAKATARIDELERRMYVSPETMAQIENGSREERHYIAPGGPGIIIAGTASDSDDK